MRSTRLQRQGRRAAFSAAALVCQPVAVVLAKGCSYGQLLRRSRAVAPDLRGHGSSSKPATESAYSFELMADDLLWLADALGWERFVLLGHSMGGMVVRFLALAAPSRLAGLILMDTAHGTLKHLDPDLIDGAVSYCPRSGNGRTGRGHGAAPRAAAHPRASATALRGDGARLPDHARPA